jgi:hypothetical protein
MNNVMPAGFGNESDLINLHGDMFEGAAIQDSQAQIA